MPKYTNRGVEAPPPEPNGYVKLLEFDVVAGSSAIDVPIPQDGLYDEYEIHLMDLVQVANPILNTFYFEVDGVLDTTSGYYYNALNLSAGTSLNINQANLNSGAVVAGQFGDLKISISNPLVGFRKQASFCFNGRNGTSPKVAIGTIIKTSLEQSSITGIQLTTTAPFDKSTIRLYGLTK